MSTYKPRTKQDVAHRVAQDIPEGAYVNLGIGQQTPPVASVLMTACSIAKADMWKVTRVNLPFIGVLFVLLMMVTYIPAIPMFLVEYFYR
jgi:TRAP-type C4-dicarboxylate transport system permease large subunit